MEYRLRFNEIRDIMEFVELVNDVEKACELVSGRYRVNAKSLMGVLAIPEAYSMILETEATEEELPAGIQKYLW
nr:HPr family phosphocarrier protein [uncultured Acetatifactor sp.]